MGGAVPGKVKLKSYQRSQGVFLSSSIVLFLNSSGSRGRVKLVDKWVFSHSINAQDGVKACGQLHRMADCEHEQVQSYSYCCG
jgi:hypothetical protein